MRKTEDMEVWSSSTPDFIHKVESVDDEFAILQMDL